MPGENGRGSSNGVSVRALVGISFGILTIAAGVAAGVGTYSGWQGAREAMSPLVGQIDERVQSAERQFEAQVDAAAEEFAKLVASARDESEERRQEIRQEFTERRREVEIRLRLELDRIMQLHSTYQAETEKALDSKADEEAHREALAHIYEEINRMRDRLERIEALVYGRSGGAR